LTGIFREDESLNNTNNESGQKNPASSALFYKAAQIIGVISGLSGCLLWLLTIGDPASTFSFSTASFAVVFVMILISIIAIIASIKGHGTMLIVLFAVSFFPIGLYVIAIPHWLRWVGLVNIGYLIAGLLIRHYRKQV